MACGRRIAGADVIRFPHRKRFDLQIPGLIHASIIQQLDIRQPVKLAEPPEYLEGNRMRLDSPHPAVRAPPAREKASVSSPRPAPISTITLPACGWYTWNQ